MHAHWRPATGGDEGTVVTTTVVIGLSVGFKQANAAALKQHMLTNLYNRWPLEACKISWLSRSSRAQAASRTLIRNRSKLPRSYIARMSRSVTFWFIRNFRDWD